MTDTAKDNVISQAINVIEKLERQRDIAIEALKFATTDFVRMNGIKEKTKISDRAEKALAEIERLNGGNND